MRGGSWAQEPLLYPFYIFDSVSDSEGKLVVREVATRPLTQDLLKHEVGF